MTTEHTTVQFKTPHNAPRLQNKERRTCLWSPIVTAQAASLLLVLVLTIAQGAKTPIDVHRWQSQGRGRREQLEFSNMSMLFLEGVGRECEDVDETGGDVHAGVCGV